MNSETHTVKTNWTDEEITKKIRRISELKKIERNAIEERYNLEREVGIYQEAIKMEIKLNKVEVILDVEIKDYESSSSACIYIPKKYANRNAKLCIMKD